MDADGKDEATLCDVVTEEVLVPAKGAPSTRWRVPQGPQGAPCECSAVEFEASYV